MEKWLDPCELQGNVDGNSYSNFLENDLPGLLGDMPVQELVLKLW